MSTFYGGPADGVTLMFSRGPLYLRVVEHRSGGGFDVLDQLTDEPRDNETVHVYRRRGVSRPAHLNFRGSAKGRSGWYEFADYEHVEVDAVTRARIRETVLWREWVDARVDP